MNKRIKRPADLDLDYLKKMIDNTSVLLPDEFSKVLVMYLIDDLSLKEIAIKLNLSLASVKNIKNKALYTLRKISDDPEFNKALTILYDKSN